VEIMLRVQSLGPHRAVNVASDGRRLVDRGGYGREIAKYLHLHSNNSASWRTDALIRMSSVAADLMGCRSGDD